MNITIQEILEPVSIGIEELGEPFIIHIEEVNGKDGEGVPKGGITGQMLVKKSGADFDMQFADQPDLTIFVEKSGTKVLSDFNFDEAAKLEVEKVANKVDQDGAKVLSTNDYDNAAVEKVAKAHDQNKDAYLDFGGGNQVSANEAKAGYTHSTQAHAPSNAENNVLEGVKRNGFLLSIANKIVNILVPTQPTDIGAQPALTTNQNFATDTEKANFHAPHSDDQDLTPYQQKSAPSLQTEAKTIEEAINEVNAKADSRLKGKSFLTEAALDAWLAIPANTATLQSGQSLFVEQLDVPDYWWNGTAKRELETQKVDLTDYVPTSRTLNNKSLGANVTLNTDDLSDIERTNKFVTEEQRNDIGHSNRTVLDATEESFTTALKNTYDEVVNTLAASWADVMNHIGHALSHVSELDRLFWDAKLEPKKEAIEDLLTGEITSHTHAFDKANYQLEFVDNTADMDKPVSTATETEIQQVVLDMKKYIKRKIIVLG